MKDCWGKHILIHSKSPCDAGTVESLHGGMACISQKLLIKTLEKRAKGRDADLSRDSPPPPRFVLPERLGAGEKGGHRRKVRGGSKGKNERAREIGGFYFGNGCHCLRSPTRLSKCVSGSHRKKWSKKRRKGGERDSENGCRGPLPAVQRWSPRRLPMGL